MEFNYLSKMLDLKLGILLLSNMKFYYSLELFGLKSELLVFLIWLIPIQLNLLFGYRLLVIDFF